MLAACQLLKLPVAEANGSALLRSQQQQCNWQAAERPSSEAHVHCSGSFGHWRVNIMVQHVELGMVTMNDLPVSCRMVSCWPLSNWQLYSWGQTVCEWQYSHPDLFAVTRRYSESCL